MSGGAVFLSYSSPDAGAARRLCDGLRAAGIDVWLDQSELRGGDAWDASIRNQIKSCALFVPVISRNTEGRDEGYFRLEWRLGVERSQLMADDHPFLLPVVVDETAEATARVPDGFRDRQWSRLPDGEATPEFIAHVKRLLAGHPAMPDLPAASAMNTVKRRNRTPAIIVIASIVAATLIALFGGRDLARRESMRQPESKPVVAPDVARKAIAVLPFVNLSGRPEDAYLADGLQEEILGALARLRDLTVISRTSVMEFRGNPQNVRAIGQRLGVGSVLEGSIRRDGSTLRLTVQLIDARDDRHLFAANYDRDMGRLLELQSAVARQVATALSATLSAYERGELDRVGTNSGDAYDLYLQGVAAFRESSTQDVVRLAAAQQLLAKAVRLDPDYVDALALLAQVNIWRYFISPQPAFAAAARQAFEHALAIDPRLPETILARGLFAMYVTQDLPQAIVDLKAVLEVRPNLASAHSALAYALRRRGDFDGALQHFIRAWDLDPLNDRYSGGPITTCLGLHRYPEAIAQTELYLKRFPGNPEPYFVRARIESFVKQDIAPLRAALQEHGDAIDAGYRKAVAAEIARAEGRYLDAVKVLEAVPTDTPIDRKYRVGFLYHAAGDAASSVRTFREVEKMLEAASAKGRGRTDDPELLAIVQSMLGRHELALATIERRIAGDPESRDATNGPELAFLRSIILVRAGRKEEGYAEVRRLLRVPFATGANFFEDPEPAWLAVKDDPHYDEILRRPPRL
jgi:TolB-like protein/Flp pilus assembly protein TadD